MANVIYDAVIVGSGASGLSAAARLCKAGKNVAVVTEKMTSGTSRNAGSDKQTYYKLTLGGDDGDSVLMMAKDLFYGGAVDGDNALCEAALSARCFFSLVEGGVPFPHNRYGEYVGYKTDHDPYRRATSAGPLTSKYMTEMWERRVSALNIPVFDGYLAVEILQNSGKVCGIMLLHKATGELTALCTRSVILATGGPAGIYADSVYPMSQTGAMSLAIDAGAELQNLTEWQYGLASTAPRWNVSGTYMQVLPRFVSIDSDGCEHEFLGKYFGDAYEAMSAVFLKGYQWPFDCRKVNGGSSVIDLLAYIERTVKNRRVYLDFTKNPFGMKHIKYERLSKTAYEYLKSADAAFGTPIDRLAKMNPPAVELYKSKGVDISKEYLEISLCAQHHNGGIAVDKWWQTTVPGLFAIGECAGTHGISRPGGSALNAGQVGALRAAQYISEQGSEIDEHAFFEAYTASRARHDALRVFLMGDADNAAELIKSARRKMSDVGAAIRSGEKIKDYLNEVRRMLAEFSDTVRVDDVCKLYLAYKYRDILETQEAVLFAMLNFAEKGYSSRGSAIICAEDGILPERLPNELRFRMSDNIARDKIQTVKKCGGSLTASFRPVRQIPEEDGFFENVWREYREKRLTR